MLKILLPSVRPSVDVRTDRRTTHMYRPLYERQQIVPQFNPNTEWHKKNGNFWKTQQILKKSNKKNVPTEIEPLQLAF